MIDQLRAIAAKWRFANQESSGGVVLIWQGAVYGWKNELRDPQHERPGAIAIDEAQCVFIAEGGNEYDGADNWGVLPSNDAVQLARSIERLSGKDFAMLTDTELQQYRYLEREGRKHGVKAWIEVLDVNEAVQGELAVASLAQQEAIYRTLRTSVHIVVL